MSLGKTLAADNREGAWGHRRPQASVRIHAGSSCAIAGTAQEAIRDLVHRLLLAAVAGGVIVIDCQQGILGLKEEAFDGIGRSAEVDWQALAGEVSKEGLP
jgi:hypothetical protein